MEQDQHIQKQPKSEYFDKSLVILCAMNAYAMGHFKIYTKLFWHVIGAPPSSSTIAIDCAKLATMLLRVAHDSQLREKYSAQIALSRILGAGASSIGDWIKFGAQSARDISLLEQKGLVSISPLQNYGLRYHSQLMEEISPLCAREILAQIVELIKQSMEYSHSGHAEYATSQMNDYIIRHLIISPTGPYRRGKATLPAKSILEDNQCGSNGKGIELIVTTGITFEPTFCRQLHNFLRHSPAYVCWITITKNYISFLYRYNSTRIVRVDIKYVPFLAHYVTLLFDTGPFTFVQRVKDRIAERNLAVTKNNELVRERTEANARIIEKIAIGSERELFTKLDIPYIEPHLR
ncbi:MAG: hypothetical protein M0R33_17255 [Methylomonas sp.]|jgi:hypothetical protein|uniref:hypothetical protein n=1 Tax=Methylomonas sp. TaxID=418 RepID=UPI0025E07206|nr:hypothetical protein [Methylomonas sp.]MCK9608195.1 hypothetical protein [Methylomonas sp.]